MPALSVPSPSAYSSKPELEFTPGPLRIYRSAQNGKWYWYMTYEIENGTGADQIWVPSMVIYTDRGEILPCGKNVPSAVTDEILDRLGDPFLEPQYKIIGDLKQGRGNARTGLSIWPANRTDVNEISLFIAGLSSETAAVKDPITGEEVVLRKTLKRDYLIPGAATAIGDRPIPAHPDMPTYEVWIFR
tara:strand:+ start:620 stop:1183 length:564 start_codon:yes stop_codon:yes gene_type:complete